MGRVVGQVKPTLDIECSLPSVSQSGSAGLNQPINLRLRAGFRLELPDAYEILELRR